MVGSILSNMNHIHITSQSHCNIQKAPHHKIHFSFSSSSKIKSNENRHVALCVSHFRRQRDRFTKPPRDPLFVLHGLRLVGTQLAMTCGGTQLEEGLE
ncbi:hypothetical protein HKD37_08G022367 [Glycine soja]|nr:hypothetical protein GmHk_08G022696 [Glycine max]